MRNSPQVNPDILAQYLDIFSRTFSFNETSRAMRRGLNTAHNWVKRSKEDQAAKVEDSIYLLEWNGNTCWFHEHFDLIYEVNTDQIEASARYRAAHGTFTPAQYQGRTVFKYNPDWLDEGMRDLLGLTDKDMYLRDASGNLVPEMVWKEPPVDLVLGILAANTKRYRRQSKLSIDMQATVSGGVVVAPAFVPPGFQPPAIAKPVASLPVIDVVAEEIEPLGEPDDFSASGTKPLSDDDAEIAAASASAAVAAPVVIKEQPSAAYTPPPPPPPSIMATGGSSLRDDLINRLRAKGMDYPGLPPTTDRSR